MRFLSSFLVSRRKVTSLFFGLLALLGVALHRDYGMSWDEPADRLNAFVSAKYVALQLAPALAKRQPRLADIPDLSRHRDADHGVLFMLPLVVLEAVWPGSDPAEWAYRRHLVGFLLFLAGGGGGVPAGAGAAGQLALGAGGSGAAGALAAHFCGGILQLQGHGVSQPVCAGHAHAHAAAAAAHAGPGPVARRRYRRRR
ncbi:hypothetical protein [Hymenobacter glacialis]|uniref:hypothetical protein n=1 Tax=Hymenobacter glacialis TaxID=1908236 RepID=UPI001300E482|nr:hypothetical protein [Hymenobacter glacialis]